MKGCFRIGDAGKGHMNWPQYFLCSNGYVEYDKAINMVSYLYYLGCKAHCSLYSAFLYMTNLTTSGIMTNGLISMKVLLVIENCLLYLGRTEVLKSYRKEIYRQIQRETKTKKKRANACVCECVCVCLFMCGQSFASHFV